MKVEGQAKVSIKGNTGVDIAGLKVAVTGDAQVDVKAPMTNLGQDLTTVKGAMVKVEGQLVKLG